MRLSPWLAGGLAGALLMLATPSPAASVPLAIEAPMESAGSEVGDIVNRPALFTEDDLLLVDVDAGDRQLTDSFSLYSSRGGVFVPLGALGRLLGLAVTIDPARGRADGWVVSDKRVLRIDLATRHGESGGRSVTVGIADAAVHDDDIYVRAEILEQLLPVSLSVDVRGLALKITAHERLPFEEQLDREQRRQQLQGGHGPASEPVLQVPSPYRVFSPPALDLNLIGGAGNHAPKATYHYDIRTAGDFAYSSMLFFVGSDDRGAPSSLRLTFDRKDPDGKLLGPLGLTRLSLGDTFSPQLAIGARSVGGRGVAFSSEPLDQTSVFNRVDLRGELPIGWEVELYVDEVLRGSRAQPVDGRYEFLGVDLTYGLNVVRLVFYGPHGERREEVRRLNVGGGQLARGQTVLSFGAVQNDLPLLNVIAQGQPAPLMPIGDLRLAAQLSHGLTATTTVGVGFSRYTPRLGDTRDLGVLSLTTSYLGMALRVNAALDDARARAVQLGLAGRPLGVSLVLRHAEYAGDFRDELVLSDPTATALRRNTDLTLGWSARVWGRTVPLSANFDRTEFADGEVRVSAGLHSSMPVHRFLVSSSISYQADGGGHILTSRQADGSLDVSGLVDGGWQVRGSLAYEIAPGFRVSGLSATVDRQIGSRTAIRLGALHTFGPGGGTSFQLTNTWRLAAADISLAGSYQTETHDVRFGLQLSLGFGYDPNRHAYRSVGPGAATGGGVAVQAFIDTDGDGVKTAGEAGIAGIAIDGGRGRRISDGQGRLLVGGLGDGSSARVRLDLSGLDDPYLSSPPAVIAIVPRPGVFVRVPYPLASTGEVEIKIVIHRRGEAVRGLSALAIQLVDASGRVAAEGRTAYDGTVLLEGLRKGRYTLRIEPSVAQRLHMALVRRTEVEIHGGGFAGRFTAEVALMPSGEPHAAAGSHAAALWRASHHRRHGRPRPGLEQPHITAVVTAGRPAWGIEPWPPFGKTPTPIGG